MLPRTCALTGVCHLILLALNKLQLRIQGIRRSRPLFLATARLTRHITRSTDLASRRTSDGRSQIAPPSPKAEADSHTWDEETMETYAESILGGKQTLSLISLIPSTPSPALINCTREGYGRISVDSVESVTDDRQTRQPWLAMKARRMAKENEEIAAGRRTAREIQTRCCICNRQTAYLNCSTAGDGSWVCSTCF